MMISSENSFKLGPKWHFPEGRKYAFTFIMLFVSLIIIYGNSFHCGWHLDDSPNIIDNTNVHLKSLSFKNIINTFYVKNFEKKGVIRPLSYLTLALNYHIGGINVFGYHIVNFTIHYFASIFLFLFIYNALQLPILRARYDKTAYAVALLSVFFWATNPIQVTAVTYIVQRMASMAGMFYIMAMYFYLKGRTATEKRKQTAFFALCGISTILSFASKENAAMLPVSLFLFDLFLIQGITPENVKNNIKIVILPLFMVLLLAHLYVDLPSILDDYKYRPFTLFERLLTEPRVILFYISLLVYPTSSRLTLLHDVEISRSFLTPWTTLPAILCLFLFIGIALRVSRRRPLIAYCIIFYFLNHVIEGSIIPLELIFEHTNYLPSMLFFTPIAVLWIHVIDYFSYNKGVQSIMSVCVIFLMAAHGHTTYLRNIVFKDGITLWTDNIKKAEKLPRPHHNLGTALLAGGFDKEGVSELLKALNNDANDKIQQNYRTHFNLGTYYLFTNEYDKALGHFLKTIHYAPDHPRTNNSIAIVMLHRNDLENAEKYCRKALSKNPDSAEFHRTLSFIFLKKGDAKNGIKEALQAMKIEGNENNSFYLLGEACRLKNQLSRSIFYFNSHLKHYPDTIASYLALIELYSLMNKPDQARQSILRLMELAGERELSEILHDFDHNYNCLDYSRIERIVQALENIGCDQFRRLKRMLGQRDLGPTKKSGPYLQPDSSVYYEK